MNNPGVCPQDSSQVPLCICGMEHLSPYRMVVRKICKEANWELKGQCLSVVRLEEVFFCILISSSHLFQPSLRLWQESKKVGFHSCPAIAIIVRNCIRIQTLSRSWENAKMSVERKKTTHYRIKPLALPRNSLHSLLPLQSATLHRLGQMPNRNTLRQKVGVLVSVFQRHLASSAGEGRSVGSHGGMRLLMSWQNKKLRQPELKDLLRPASSDIR